MPNVNLTTIGVERAKPPKSGRRELWDSVVPGLYTRITDKGLKPMLSWHGCTESSSALPLVVTVSSA
jgi:hypothetical protein